MLSESKSIHIISEFSIKNYSISSIVEFLISNNNKIHVLTNDLYKDFNINQNKCIVLQKGKFNFIRNFIIILITLRKFSEVHIHGVWSYLNLLSIFLSLYLNKKIFLYPHGMLMDRAIEKPNLIKSFIKKLIIKILYFHNYKKIVFSAASRQEAKSIQKKFNEAKIFLNLNFIPFKPSNERVQKFEKKFVFFGRANPHKNIEKIIKGFIKSNLPHDWKLDLFCIDDNLKYLEMLKNKYLDYKNVRFNTPVFGARKNNIMSRSWANIIMSDSEVLSLSILECGINGLPTIINLDIEIVKEDKFSPTCKPDEEDIANKIIEVANWSEQDRYDISIQLKDVYKKYLYKEYDFKEEFKK